MDTLPGNHWHHLPADEVIAFTYAPWMNRLFASAPLPAFLWLDVLVVGLVAFIMIEIEKWLRRMRAK